MGMKVGSDGQTGSFWQGQTHPMAYRSCYRKGGWRQTCGDSQTVRAGMGRVDRIAVGIQRDGDGFAFCADLQSLAKGHLAAGKRTSDRRDKHRQAQAKGQQGF